MGLIALFVKKKDTEIGIWLRGILWMTASILIALRYGGLWTFSLLALPFFAIILKYWDGFVKEVKKYELSLRGLFWFLSIGFVVCLCFGLRGCDNQKVDPNDKCSISAYEQLPIGSDPTMSEAYRE
jgi:hypothetical protein